MIKPHGFNTLNPLFIIDADERTALIKEARGNFNTHASWEIERRRYSC